MSRTTCIKPGDVLAFGPWDAVSIGIKVFTRSWISHVGIVGLDGKLYEATIPRVRVVPARLPKRVYRSVVPIPEPTKMQAFLDDNLGRDYKLGLWYDPQAFFCSEFVAGALHAGGILSHPYAATPRRLLTALEHGSFTRLKEFTLV